jgi:hypothetical protein
MEIVEVLHPPRNIIPLRTIGDTTEEVISRADVAEVHGGAVVCVQVGQVLEHLVIRSN